MEMDECDLASCGLSFRETYKKWDYGYEVHGSLYTHKGDFVAGFSTTTHVSRGEQTLNTNTQFVQLNYLTPEQIKTITEWLRKCAVAARWRLTSFTTLVETHP
jgi:hypothetical protein